MWNLLEIGNNNDTYQPSSLTGTFVTGTAANAYDKPSGLWDDYPYTTSCTLAASSSSGTAGTPDSVSGVVSGFPSLAKSDINILTLQLGLTISVHYAQMFYNIVTSAIKIEISYDAGTSWTLWKTYGVYKNGTMYSSTAAEYTILSSDTITVDYLSKITLTKNIIPSNLAVGLSSLQLRFTASTIKSATYSSTYSDASVLVWDVRAMVSR